MGRVTASNNTYVQEWTSSFASGFDMGLCENSRVLKAFEGHSLFKWPMPHWQAKIGLSQNPCWLMFDNWTLHVLMVSYPWRSFFGISASGNTIGMIWWGIIPAMVPWGKLHRSRKSTSCRLFAQGNRVFHIFMPSRRAAAASAASGASATSARASATSGLVAMGGTAETVTCEKQTRRSWINRKLRFTSSSPVNHRHFPQVRFLDFVLGSSSPRCS